MAIHHSSGKWSDRDFVRVWDSQPTMPLKAEQLDILAEVIKENWRRGARILDLGCGTGKAEALILERLPVARFVCVDRSEVMLDFARERLSRFSSQCRFVTADLNHAEALRAPGAPFRFIVTVDAIHELPDAAKARLFKFCRRNLTHDGLLLILDRSRSTSPVSIAPSRAYWTGCSARLGLIRASYPTTSWTRAAGTTSTHWRSSPTFGSCAVPASPLPCCTSTCTRLSSLSARFRCKPAADACPSAPINLVICGSPSTTLKSSPRSPFPH